ncbi:MAG TPA: BTAD domain-containing putative transcriptional regulator [Gaiellaceae bacterium]
MPTEAIEVRLLGPVVATRGGEPVTLGGPKQRAVLALLALRVGTVVPADRLVEALWGASPPPTAATALHGHVSRLRRALGKDAIATRAPGYVLEAEIDLGRFEALVAAAHDQEGAAREASLRQALALWRGPALADLLDEAELGDEARRLEELRLVAQEDLFDAQLALGRHAVLVPRLEAFARAEPFRERPAGQLMLALYRSGRQADALDVYRRFRQRLSESLGLEPGPELRALERRVLEHDPALAPPRATPPDPPAHRRLPLTAVAIGFAAPDADDVEAYGRIVAGAREAARLALERHGAAVERIAGSGLLGLFGTPVAHEDAAGRALRAAREAVDDVIGLAGEAARFGVRLRASAGVASGEVYAGESPAIEQALRMLRDAPAGEVIADDTTRLRARERELRLDRPPAGREREQRLLRDAFEATVRERRGRAVALVGPPGIGKSRLAADLLASLDGVAHLLRTRCLPYGDGVGLLPAIDLVRAAAGTVSPEGLSALLGGDERAAAAVEALVDLVGGTREPATEEPGWAVRRLLERLARTAPVVVWVDDLHWAARPFLEVVEQIVAPGDAPILVVATARALPDARLEPEEIALGPLTIDGCAALVGDLLGAAELDPGVTARLVDASGGNPLFLEELVLHLRDTGRLREEDDGWLLEGPVSAPPSIQTLIAARLERLPAAERDLLARASVAGRGFSLAALADLVDGDPGEPLVSLVGSGLVQPADGEEQDFEFHHLLVRDAAYASLPLELRGDLHARHAAWIEREAVAAPREREALAVYHLDQSHRARAALAPDDPGLADAALRLAERTAELGRTLLGRGDAAAAAALLARAYELAPDDRVGVELGRAHMDVGDFAAADEAFAAAEGGDLAERARLGRLEVRLHTDPSSDLAAADVEVDRTLASLERAGDADGVAEAWLARAYLATVRARAAELGEIVERALVHARATARLRAETWLLFLVCSVCWYGPLPVDDGIRRCEQVLAEARDRPGLEAAALQSLAVLRAMRGEVDEARTLVASSRAIRREIGQRIGAAASSIDAGIVELLAGDYAGAEDVLREGHDELERLGEQGYHSTVLSLLAEAVGAQGRHGEARELARATAEASGEDDVVSQIGWRCVEARALAADGDGEAAEALAAEAVALGEATDFAIARAQAATALADVRAARGDAGGAAQARAAAAELLARKGCAESAIRAWTRSA